MNKRWEFKFTPEKSEIERLGSVLKINPVLIKLLLQRGIEDFDTAKDYFRPNLNSLHDPFLMADMDKAVARIEKAIQNKERILVFGDYDVDGTTAVALVYSFFNSFYRHLDYYIPDRYKEGYGISFQGIDYAKDTNASLIIALDCGIKSIDKIKYAAEKGIDFIICDHHLPGKNIPEAIAVLDPKRLDCNYPYKELSGCGIGFKLIQAYSFKNKLPFEHLYKYLDLTAISIGADIVPLTGENRTLAYFGLIEINKKRRPGIKAILELNKVNKELSITDVVFILAPRINAAGRVASGNKAVELLISESEEESYFVGTLINQNNDERKGLDADITTQALQLIKDSESLQRKKTTVLYHPEWHKGVIGIVASRLTETYYRPTILLAQSNGKATGSARSVKNFDIHQAIEACGDLLEQFGGHKYAAGLTLKIENIAAFAERFEEVVNSSIEDELLIPHLEIDSNITLEEITPKFCAILQQFSPFGPENMAPLFASYGLIDKGYAKIVGEKHLKLELAHPDNTSKSFGAIAFNHGSLFEKIKNEPFNVVFSIEENTWKGKTNIQLNIKDITFESYR